MHALKLLRSATVTTALLYSGSDGFTVHEGACESEFESSDFTPHQCYLPEHDGALRSVLAIQTLIISEDPGVQHIAGVRGPSHPS